MYTSGTIVTDNATLMYNNQTYSFTTYWKDLDQHPYKALLTKTIALLHQKTAPTRATRLVNVKANKKKQLKEATVEAAEEGTTSDDYPNESFNARHAKDMQIIPWPTQQTEDRKGAQRSPMTMEDAITRRAKSSIQEPGESAPTEVDMSLHHDRHRQPAAGRDITAELRRSKELTTRQIGLQLQHAGLRIS